MSTKTFIKSIQLILFFALLSCGGGPTNKDGQTTAEQGAESSKEKADAPGVAVLKSDLQESSNATKISISDGNGGLIKAQEKGWASFNLNVPEAGRYKVVVKVNNPGDEQRALWLEDYIDNEDQRSYNVTGNMLAKGQGEHLLSKDGSPLAKGLHPMRIHFDGPVEVESIEIELLKAQVLTPNNYVQSYEGDQWEVVWADEFEGEVLDTTKWTYDLGDWGWGNNELQYYTVDRKENTRLEDGNLVIEARMEEDGSWTSGRITTREKASFTYGKIEFRAKVPPLRGNWAAGWTLGDAYVDEKSWPYCGEIDIMESVGYEMDDETGDGVAHASVHTRAYYFKLDNHKTAIRDVSNMNNEYHTYAVEWTPTEIKGFVDGIHYYTYDYTANELEWPFNVGQNIILNLAIGGGWGGLKGLDPEMKSQKMLIDYVRVYGRK